MRLVLFTLVVAVTLLVGTDASTKNNNVKPQAVEDIAVRLLKRRSDGIDGAWVDAADQEERVNSAAVATLTKSSSAKYKTWWNKALASIFKHMTPKKYRPSEAKMTTNTGRYHPFRLEGN
ncbi:hypothetical protein DVH05_024744 [Phytophthora capsici]|nr:hypothetical protein DVH05_024744 [Phytophthora capsici]